MKLVAIAQAEACVTIAMASVPASTGTTAKSVNIKRCWDRSQHVEEVSGVFGECI